MEKQFASDNKSSVSNLFAVSNESGIKRRPNERTITASQPTAKVTESKARHHS